MAALRDTLALRLFGLIWAALVLSHLAAWLVSTQLLDRGMPTAATRAAGDEPPPPPPAGGFRPEPPGATAGPPPGPPHEGPPHEGPPHEGPPHEGPPHESPPHEGPPLPTLPSLPPGLPWPVLLVDYGVRLLLIGAAAWWGSRWLAAPMARLAAGSQALGPALARGQSPPALDEASGTAEVRATAGVFNRMAAQIRSLFEARGLMVAAISHDLRTPITRMRLRLETAAIEPALRERCTADLREMDTLIGSVLDTFRGGTPVALQRTDVRALAQALLDDREELGAQVALLAPAVVGDTDPQALRRLLGNLVDNALRHAGHVEVSLLPLPGAVEIRVEDRGPGIPPDQLQAVLEPFARVEGSRHAAGGGTGLGLYIARELALRLGAELQLANREGGGLQARVLLPLGPAATTSPTLPE